MVSIAKVRQASIAPLQGAALSLAIITLAWVIGVLDAAGIGHSLVIPIAMALGLLFGVWFVREMAWIAVLLGVVAAVGIYSPVLPRLARPFVRTDVMNLDQLDAVVVFSGGVNSRGLVNGEALDRLLSGIALRARRPALPLVVSIVRASGQFGGPSSQVDQRALIGMAPATGPVEWIDSVYSTRDEALGFSRLAMTRQWKRVAVVTSPMHSRRACAALEQLGVTVTCVPAPWRPAAWPPRTGKDRLYVMQRLTYEALAWVQYRSTGWARWSRG